MANAPLGATVTIQIPDGHAVNTAGMQVPIGALFDAGKGPGVWVINGKPARVTWRPVSVLHLSDDGARIDGQIRQGDRVVALGAHLLREGQQVRLADNAVATAAEGVKP